MSKSIFMQLIYAAILNAAIFGAALAEYEGNGSYDGTQWNGMYKTNIRPAGVDGVWESPNTFIVSWGKDLAYGGSRVESAEFFNNSSISWNGDPSAGSGQIWFFWGDNRTSYWPGGPVSGRVFTGIMSSNAGESYDIRGLNETTYEDISRSRINCTGPNCVALNASCEPCYNGKVCQNGKCVCPGGITDCFGQCVTPEPCGSGCWGGKACISGRCVCIESMKECNDRCIGKNECCGGCPPWKVCDNGTCICPPGKTSCPDPLPL